MSTHDRITNRIKRRGRGFVFSPGDFADLGSRAAVDKTLSRLTKAGTIRRLDRGTYDYPAKSSRAGLRSPDPDSVARAATRRLGARFQRPGAVAALALGISDQVPGRALYLTDAPTRNVKAGNRQVLLRHASRRQLVGAGTVVGDVYHALRFVGRTAIDDQLIDKLRQRLTDQDKQQIRKDLTGLPAWAQDVMRRVVA